METIWNTLTAPLPFWESHPMAAVLAISFVCCAAFVAFRWARS